MIYDFNFQNNSANLFGKDFGSNFKKLKIENNDEKLEYFEREN